MTSEDAVRRSRSSPKKSLLARLSLLATLAALAALTAAGAAACRDSPTDAPPQGEGLIEEGEAALAPGGAGSAYGDLGLEGRLLWIEAPDDRVDNIASVLDLSSGETTRLWSTGTGTNLSDVALSPDGSKIAYRLVQRESAPPEAIMVRRLAPGAEPMVIATIETDVGHLTGFAWAPDGTGIAYGRQLGHLRVNENGASPFDRWELHVASADGLDAANGHTASDTAVWAIDGQELGPVALHVVAWDPSAGLVAVTETPADGGAAVAVRLVDTAVGEERDRVPAGVLEFEAVGSPDGRFVAMPDAEVGSARLTVLEVPAGETFEVLTGESATVGAPIWSADSSWLGWTSHVCGDDIAGLEDCTVHALPVPSLLSGITDDAFGHAVKGESYRALAFDPDAGYMLVAETLPGEVAWAGLSAHALDGSGEGLALPWQPPHGAWFAAWVP
jgi:hypothetical protein